MRGDVPTLGESKPALTVEHGPPTNFHLGLVVLALIALATWALSHSYMGIFHDARLYTLQALSHIHPETLGRDVFLKFGSQDQFTIFSTLYARLSRIMGVEAAAAALTLTFQLGFVVSAWLLARTVTGAWEASLGVCVLLAIPGQYGAGTIFKCIEPFLTPRMGAEALALGGLAAALNSRRILAACLMILAVAVHPIMAAGGLVASYCYVVLIPRPRLALVSLPAVLAIGVFVFMRGRFDTTWLRLIEHRSSFLFLSNWDITDWAQVVVLLATLIAGVRTYSIMNARKLCLAAAMTLVGGLMVTFAACDLFHLVLLTQAQPWRWQWLGTVVAALLLPRIVCSLWREENSGRTTAILLAAAWIFTPTANAMLAALAALASLLFLNRLKPTGARLIFWGACGMLAIAVAWRLASNLQLTAALYLDTRIPLWIRRMMAFANDGSAPFAVVASVAWLAQARRRLPGLIITGCAAAALCVALIPQTWRSWMEREFPPPRIDQFAIMRAHIPDGSEVFWPGSPLGAWLLLSAPSYISPAQTGGIVFNRQTALEFDRRAHALSSIIPQGQLMDLGMTPYELSLSKPQLQQACATREFDFLVTAADLGVEPVAIVPPASGTSSRGMRLYRCRAPS